MAGWLGIGGTNKAAAHRAKKGKAAKDAPGGAAGGLVPDVGEEEEPLVKHAAKKEWIVLKKWRELSATREFALYMLFVILFSLVVFRSKPGAIQFELQNMHTQNIGAGIDSVKRLSHLYSWLSGPFANRFFPEFDPAGNLLSSKQRLTISGQSLAIGAARLRVMRAVQQECAVPNFLKDVNGKRVLCSVPYSLSSRLREDIHLMGSEQWNELNALDMVLPFKYQTASKLGTTSAYAESGVYGTYYQDGHALDIVPNLSPNQLSSAIADCMPIMVTSLNKCKNDLIATGVLSAEEMVLSSASRTPVDTNATESEGEADGQEEDGIVFFGPPRMPPIPGAEDHRCPVDVLPDGSQCIAAEQLIVPEAMLPYLHQCQRLSDPAGVCQLHHVGFAQMYEMQKAERCGGCKCMCGTDPVCARTCSPKDLFLDQLNVLQYYNWVNASTARAVALDVSLLNPHHNLMTMWRGLSELPPTGEVYTHDILRTVRIYRYTTGIDRAYLAVEIMLIMLLVYYILIEMYEIFVSVRDPAPEKRWSYFKQAWNYIDWANYLLIIVAMAIRISSVVVISRFNVDSAQTIVYLDYPPLAQFAITELNLLAFNFFMIYFKIFKYINRVPKMNMIVDTISSAFLELFLFMIMAAIVLFGFSSAFYVCFGSDVFDYKGLGESLGSLVRICLGSFKYHEMSAANPSMTPLLFYLLIVVVLFVLLSMFVAIIDDSFSGVKEKDAEAGTQVLLQNMMGTVTGAFRRKKDIDSLGKAFMKADHEGEGGNLDGMVDVEEMRAVLQDHPNALSILNCGSVEELMERFDTSGDGQLDRKELRVILEELAAMEEEEEEKIDAAEDLEMSPEDWNKLSLNERIRMGRKGYHPRSKHELNFVVLDKKVAGIEKDLSDLSNTVAKKLSLMVDLMVGLSETLQNPNSGRR